MPFFRPLLVAAPVSAVFDPATLSLTGWWRASYSGSPWTPTASAGTSGTNGNLAEATNPPAVGAAVNGYTPADCDGINDKLTSSASPTTLLSTTAWSVVLLVKAESAAVQTDVYSDENILMDSNQAFGVAVSTSGGSPALRVFHYDGTGFRADTITGASWAHSSFKLIQAKYTGVVIKGRVNSDSWTAGTAANAMTANGVSMILGNNAGSAYFDGEVLEVMTAATALSDADFDNIKSYVNSRYGLSL